MTLRRNKLIKKIVNALKKGKITADDWNQAAEKLYKLNGCKKVVKEQQQ